MKGKYPALAETFYTLALEEKKHMEILHEKVVWLIEETKKTEKEPPKYMLEMWDDMHDKIIDEMVEVKAMIEMYKR